MTKTDRLNLIRSRYRSLGGPKDPYSRTYMSYADPGKPVPNHWHLNPAPGCGVSREWVEIPEA